MWDDLRDLYLIGYPIAIGCTIAIVAVSGMIVWLGGLIFG
jgi:hypothetical protein